MISATCSFAALALVVGAPIEAPAGAWSQPPAQPPATQQVTNPPQEFPPITVKAPPRPAPGASFRNADELLVALEDADRGMSSLVAQVVYQKTLVTVGDTQTRSGRLYFVSDRAGRRFAIEFDTFVRGDGTIDNDPQLYIFDGQWLLDKRSRDKRFTKKQVVPPGQKFDPLKIGEGPFPIPVGQKRDDILARYNAELLAPEAGIDPKDRKSLDFVKGAYQLRLVPRPDRPDQDKFKEIRLWYRADAPDGGRLLPRMARTVAVGAEPGEDGNTSVVRLVNVKVNTPVDPSVIDTSTPPASEGWDGVVTDFRDSAPR